MISLASYGQNVHLRRLAALLVQPLNGKHQPRLQQAGFLSKQVTQAVHALATPRHQWFVRASMLHAAGGLVGPSGPKHY